MQPPPPPTRTCIIRRCRRTPSLLHSTLHADGGDARRNAGVEHRRRRLQPLRLLRRIHHARGGQTIRRSWTPTAVQEQTWMVKALAWRSVMSISALLERPSEVRRKDSSFIMNMQRSKGSVLERKR